MALQSSLEVDQDGQNFTLPCQSVMVCGEDRGGARPWERHSLQNRQSLKRLAAEGTLPTVLSVLGTQVFHGKENVWLISV